MAKHTEGPYTLVKKFADPGDVYGMAEIHAPTHFPLIELEICNEKTRANAYLFAAAPEMLESLKGLDESIRIVQNEWPNGVAKSSFLGAFVGEINRMRDVIAKAEAANV